MPAIESNMIFRRFSGVLICAATFGLLTAGCEGQSQESLNRPAARPPELCLGGLAAETSVSPPPSEVTLKVGDRDWDTTFARVWAPLVHSLASTVGLIFVTGVDGGYDEPADAIYTATAEKFAKFGVRSVFVHYREPGDLQTSLEDAKAAAQYLREKGIGRIAILGWSFGGAVITNTAALIPEIVTVVGFAPQSAETVPILPTQSILLIHSESDENVPVSASEDILAETPVQSRHEFLRLTGYDHRLDGASPEVAPRVARWLQRELSVDPACRD